MVLASKAVARGAVLVDSVQGVGCMAQDLEMAVLEGEGVQDVPEVTAAFAVDPCFAVHAAWGWLVPSFQVQFSPHGLERSDPV